MKYLTNVFNVKNNAIKTKQYVQITKNKLYFHLHSQEKVVEDAENLVFDS